LDHSGEISCMMMDQSWVRSASGALEMFQEAKRRRLELEAQLGDLQASLQSCDPMGTLGNEAQLARTLQDISVESERLDAYRQQAQQELDSFLQKHQNLFSTALALAQPSLVGGPAEALRAAASAVAAPLLHFRKVLANAKSLKEASSHGLSTPSVIRDLRALPASVAGLLQQSEAWLDTKSSSGNIRRDLPAPPEAPPPPPPPEKEIDDGDPVTTEAGSSPTSEEESTPNDGAEDEEARSQLAAGTEPTEEENLAQDREEVEGPPPAEPLEERPIRSQESPELNTSFDEEDASEEEACDEDGDLETAWRAQATYAVRSISRKIPKASIQVDKQAEALIAAATSPDELAQMYEGWTAWI